MSWRKRVGEGAPLLQEGMDKKQDNDKDNEKKERDKGNKEKERNTSNKQEQS